MARQVPETHQIKPPAGPYPVMGHPAQTPCIPPIIEMWHQQGNTKTGVDIPRLKILA
jgi:hypothetical protein